MTGARSIGKGSARQARPPLRLRKMPLSVPAKASSGVAQARALTLRSMRPKFHPRHETPRSVEAKMPSSALAASKAPSSSKAGESASATTSGGGLLSAAANQAPPPSLERNIPPLMPAKTLRPWAASEVVATGPSAFSSVPASSQLTPPSCER